MSDLVTPLFKAHPLPLKLTVQCGEWSAAGLPVPPSASLLSSPRVLCSLRSKSHTPFFLSVPQSHQALFYSSGLCAYSPHFLVSCPLLSQTFIHGLPFAHSFRF